MKEYSDEIQEIVYDEYCEELGKRDQKIKELTQELTENNKKLTEADLELNKIKYEYKSEIEKLNEMDDLNTPQAKKIIKSLLILLK